MKILCDICGQEISEWRAGKWLHVNWALRFHRAKPMKIRESKFYKSYADDGTPTGVADASGDPADALLAIAAAHFVQSERAETKQESDDSWAAVGLSADMEKPDLTRNTFSTVGYPDYVKPSQPWPTTSPQIELEAPEPPSPSSDCCDSTSDSSSSCDCSSSSDSSSS